MESALAGRRSSGPIDAATVAAIAVLVYAASSILHEAVGHGGTCLLVGGQAVRLTSASFDCNVASGGPAAHRAIAAGGTVVNLIVGVAALVAFGVSKAVNRSRFALWLLSAVNLMVGVGYFFYSGISGIGDWAVVASGIGPVWLWRGALAIGGFASYMALTTMLFRRLGGMLPGDAAARYAVANRVAVVSFLTGGLLECVSGAFNPGGAVILIVSAAAASLGGTSGLAWGAQVLRGETGVNDVPPFTIQRSRLLIVLAIAIAIPFIVVFGRGVAL